MSLKVVIISYCGTSEAYVAGKIIERYPSTVVVQPVRSQRAPGMHISSLTGAARLLRSWLGKMGESRHSARLIHRLYPGGTQPSIPNIVPFPESDMNSRPGVELIGSLQPDVLLSCGAPMLSAELIGIPKLAAINIHYGIPPHYRGNNTLFWPMLKRDFNNLGACIHHLTKGVDTGNLLAVIRPALQPKDGLLSVEFKITHLLPGVLLEFLAIIEQSHAVPGIPQTGAGRNYKKKERTIRKRIEYHLKRTFGLLHIPSRPAEVITYFGDIRPSQGKIGHEGLGLKQEKIII